MLGFFLAAPAGQASGGSTVRLNCNGPAGLLANVTWTWTYRDRVFPELIRRVSYWQLCSGSETTTAFANRFPTSFGFSISANLTFGGKSTLFSVGKVVDPSHEFNFNDRFVLIDPVSVHIHVKA